MTAAPELAHSQPPDVTVRRDKTVWWVALCATLLSVAAYVYVAKHGLALGYKDSISHLQIASRTINSPTSGFAQLGGVWLPMPHLLMLPFIWIAPLYYSGFAGSIVSMISFVVTCVFIYKIVIGLTRSKKAAIAGTLVFALNPNVLYMQSIPMTELLLFASIAAMVYYTQQWIQTQEHARKYPYLFAAATAAFVGCLTRYEAWVVTAVMASIILVAAWKQYGRKAAGGVLVSYSYLAGFGIALWLMWNFLIFGNPLNFQNGQYAKPSLWVGEDEPSVGNPVIAFKTYWYAMTDNLGLAIVLVMLFGVVVILLRRRTLDILPTLGLLAIAPFFVFALTVGQRPLHVEQITQDLYNVRFGLMMILPAAIILGYLVSQLPARAQVVGLVATSALTVLIMVPGGLTQTVTAREGSIGFPQTALDTSAYLRENYDGGVILIESFGNESILFDARISLSQNIYEGSYLKWDPAISNPPGQQIQWIVMRIGNTPDHTYTELYGSSKLSEYKEVFSNDLYAVYRRKA